MKNNKAKKTQRQQATAKPKLHPRGLARSVAKYLGASRGTWRDQVAALPRHGQKYLHPEKYRLEAKA